MGCENSFSEKVNELHGNIANLLFSAVETEENVMESKSLLNEALRINQTARDNEIGLSSHINSDGELIITRTENSFIDNVFLEDGKLILKIEE